MGWKFQGLTLENLNRHVKMASQNSMDCSAPSALQETQEEEQERASLQNDNQPVSTAITSTKNDTGSAEAHPLVQNDLLQGVSLASGSTAWSVIILYREGEFQGQWHLAYRPGEFPFSSGTHLSYQGDPYVLTRIAGSRTLKVLALSQPIGETDDPEQYLDSLHHTRSAGKKMPWRRRTTAMKPVVPLREVSTSTKRDYDQIVPRFTYQVEARALPDILYERLPDETERCYVQLFSRNNEPGDFARVATSPKGLSNARVIDLQEHEGSLVASLIEDAIRNPEAVVRDIRMLPVYLLPLALRRKVSSTLSYLQPTASSELSQHKKQQQREGGAAKVSSDIGDLTSEQLARIRKWSGQDTAELFDYACIAVTDDSNEDGMLRVDVSVFADRLTGQRSGRVYKDECWMSQECIDQALPWTPAFDRRESYIRRVQVMAHALAHGASRPTKQDLLAAQPKAHKEDKEEAQFLVSRNIRVSEQAIQPLFERVHSFEAQLQEGGVITVALPTQEDLFQLAAQAVERDYEASQFNEGEAAKYKHLLQYIVQAKDCWERAGKPRMIGFAPAVVEQEEEQIIQLSLTDGPQGDIPAWRTCTRIERRRHQVGYDLVIGIPHTMKMSREDLERITQVPRPEIPWGTPKAILAPRPERIPWPKRPKPQAKDEQPTRSRVIRRHASEVERVECV